MTGALYIAVDLGAGSGRRDRQHLWNTGDLGYLTVYAANALSNGSLKVGDAKLAAGRLKDIEIAGDEVHLGKPFVFNTDNIDQFDF